jgi:hypothetical protein
VRFGFPRLDVFQSSEPTTSPARGGIHESSSLPSSGRSVRASAGGKAPSLFTPVAEAAVSARGMREVGHRSQGPLVVLPLGEAERHPHAPLMRLADRGRSLWSPFQREPGRETHLDR